MLSSLCPAQGWKSRDRSFAVPAVSARRGQGRISNTTAARRRIQQQQPQRTRPTHSSTELERTRSHEKFTLFFSVNCYSVNREGPRVPQPQLRIADGSRRSAARSNICISLFGGRAQDDGRLTRKSGLRIPRSLLLVSAGLEPGVWEHERAPEGGGRRGGDGCTLRGKIRWKEGQGR